jgi:hypothetical protein
MKCTCNCIAFIQMITKNLSNFCQSSFHTLSGDNTFLCLLNLFPSFQGEVSLTGWQHSAANPESLVCVCVCACARVCVGSPSVYMKPSSTFSTCFVLSGKCFVNGMTTLWSMLFTWATICCMLESRKPYKHLHSGSWRENKELQWHFKQTVALQFCYVSLLSY